MTRDEYLLEGHFANTLSPAEGQELRRLLADNPAVAEDLAWQQQLAAAVRQTGFYTAERTQLQQRYAPAGQPQQPNQGQAARPMLLTVTFRRLLAVAASLALLFVAYPFIKNALQPTQPLDQAVAANFSHYPNKMAFQSLGGAEDVSPEVRRAFARYNRAESDSSQYPQAAAALQAVVAAHPDRLDYRFYYGVTLIGAKDYAGAANALQPVAATANGYRTPALYFLGLAQAGQGDRAAARQSLQDYVHAGEGLTYRAKAEAVLKSLGK